MRFAMPLLSIILSSFLLLVVAHPVLSADTVREAMVAGRFYPAAPEKLRSMLASLTQQARQTKVTLPPDQNLRALIMPHAGYIYSGLTAAHASRVLGAKMPQKVVLAGPSHHHTFDGGVVSAASGYRTPLGLIPLHGDSRRLAWKSRHFTVRPEVEHGEHSLEVILPFLQYYLGEFQLLPLILGQSSLERIEAMARDLEPFLDSDSLLVLSSDLSHYLPYDQARAWDADTIAAILRLDSQALAHRNNAACGHKPILLALALARRHHWQPVLLHYTTSGDTAGNRNRVVGYATIAFYGGEDMQAGPTPSPSLTAAQGDVLLKLARQTLSDQLGSPVPEAEKAALAEALNTPVFQNHCGTFVTLKIKGELRGCIGSLSTRESITQGVRDNVVNAAFRDPRFRPLLLQELSRVAIEVSVLSDPKPLDYEHADDLLTRLQPGIDGVILRQGGASATFLPQVWEQLPHPESFLTHLCLKAGLARDAWRTQHPDILTYQVQYFEESH